MFSWLNDPEHWLSQEKEARISAEATGHMKAREFLLRLADDYHRGAEVADKRRMREKVYRSAHLFCLSKGE
jgi:hypothetical protein